MPLLVNCQCGGAYELKDELAGKPVQCPECGAVNRSAGGLSPRSQADPAFNRDQYLMRQRHLAINEKYYIYDESGAALLFVERPAHLIRNLLATFAALILSGFATLSLAVIGDAAGGPLAELVEALGSVIFVAIFAVLFLLFMRKRHVTFYRDDTRSERLFEILQERRFQFPIATYSVRDVKGRLMGRLRKNYLYNVFRKRWEVRGIRDEIVCVAREDSIILSLLRRVLGPLYGLLRTNFLITRGTGNAALGEFKRKLTILDKYVLDLSADAGRTLDRRIALALGVMLDTGERR